MTGALLLDRRVSLALLVTIAVQTGAALIWTGRAAERLDALERAERATRPDAVRLARLETRLDHMTRQLDRIEARLEREP
mgnify:CR=1 FL=1